MKTPSHSLWAKCIRLSFIFASALLLAISARATGSTTLVISQVYGAGGNTGANWQNDYIELFNLTGSSISLNGWSVQYASATGNSWQVTALTGSIPANGYYLVKEGAGAGNGSPLPGFDASATIAMSGTAGKVALCNSTTALTLANPFPNPAIIDFVGFGTAATTFEGSGPTGTLTATTAAIRNSSGCQDTDNNSSDFTVATASPRYSASPTHSCGVGAPTQIRVETANDGSGTVVSARNVAAGNPLTVYAVARDLGGNFVSATNGTWSLLSKTGGVVDGDLVPAGGNASAVFTGHIIGTAVIDVATAGLTSVDSGTITVTNGTPTQLSLETLASGNGTLITNQTVASGNSVTARSIRRDAWNNFVDNVAADSWTLINKTSAVADTDLSTNANMKSAVFTGNGVGTAQIHAVSGALTADSGVLTVQQVAPTITTQPANITTNSGVNVTFFVSVSGSTPFTYQWKKNGNDIANATNASLTLSNVTKLNEGSYSVGVTNGAGGVVSSDGTLTLNVNAFTLMTYNVKGNFSANWDINHPQVQALGRQLTYLQPDVITFNEIPNGSNATLNAIIANYLPGYVSTQTDAATDGGIRSAIVSRWPIIASNSFFHNLDLTPWGASGQTFTRDLYVARIQVPGMSRPLNVATTHLKANGSPQVDACIRRAAEANVVSNFFYNFKQTNTTDYYLVTGDWNQTFGVVSPCDVTNKPIESITASNATGLFLTTPVDPNSPGASTNYYTHDIQGTFNDRYDYIVPCGTLFTNISSSKIFRTSTLPSLTGTGLNANDDATTSDHLPVLMSFNNPETASPTFAVQPASTTANASSTVQLSVVAGGATPLTYQWYKGATALSNGAGPGTATVAGASTAILTLTGVYANDAGSYSVSVTNALGATNSSAAVLTVVDPAILTNPVGQTNAAGSTITLSAVPAGTAPLTFVWQKGGANLSNGGIISGASTTALNLTGVTTNDAGSYTFVVSNPNGSVTSSVAKVSITVAPTVLTGPSNQTVNAGSIVLFTGSNSGTPTPVAHWERNGVTITNCTSCTAGGFGISGATGNNLRITNVIAGDAGNYTYVASNSTGMATSAVAILTVNDPFITLQPADAAATLGGTAIFSAVASGTAPITYRWQKNGVNLSDGGRISGATTTNLSISTVSTNDLASYRVVVTGSSTLTSSSAQLVLSAAGGEVLMNTASYSQNFDGIGSSGTATLPAGWVMSPQSGGATPTFSAGITTVNAQASSGAPVTGARYNWGDGNNTSDRAIGFMTSSGYSSPNSIMLGLYNNTGSNITGLTFSYNFERYRINTAAAAITLWASTDGVSWTSYPVGDCTYDTGTSAYFFSAVQQSNRVVNFTGMNVPVGGKMYFRWSFSTTGSNSEGLGLDDVSVTATVATPAAVPPTITAQPTGGTVWQGTNFSMAIQATGDAPLSYQWFKNNNPITDKTNASLALTSVTTAESGTYYCQVTNDAGSTNSNPAVLVVKAPITATIAQLRALLDNTTWVPNDTTNIYKVTGTVTTFTNTVTGNNTLFAMQDNTAGIWVFFSGTNTTINAGDSVQVVAPVADFQGRLELSVATSNPTHSFSVLSWGNPLPAAALFALSSQTVIPTAESLEGSRIVISNVLMDLRTNIFVTNSLLTVTNANNLAETFQMRIDAHCADFQGQAKPTSPMLVIGTLDQSTTNSPRTNNYRLVPTRFSDLTVLGPTITTAPSSHTVNFGDTTTFSAAATGGTVTYQWQKNGVNLSDGGNVSGSTTTSLTLSSVTHSDDADYAVVASNGSVPTTSSSAHLTVTEPIITGQPASATVDQGRNASVSVSAQGSAALSYEWSLNGLPVNEGGRISGSATATLSIANAQPSDSGTYSVVVTDTYGSTTSDGTSVLTVTPAVPLSIANDVSPSALSNLPQGTNFTLAVGISGGPVFTYQWYTTEGGLIPGATDGTNNFVAQPAGVPGAKFATNHYYLIATGGVNSVTSSVATVTIALDTKTPNLFLKTPVKLSTAVAPFSGIYGASPVSPGKAWAITGLATDTNSATQKGNIAHVYYYFISSNAPSPIVSQPYEAVLTNKTVGREDIKGFNITTNIPPAGTNVLVIWAVDLAGNLSKPVTNLFFYQSQTPFTLNKHGDGTGKVTVKSKLGDNVTIPFFGVGDSAPTVNLNIGETYSLSYTPDRKTKDTNVTSSLTNAPGMGAGTNTIKKYTGPDIVVEPTTADSVTFEFDRDRFYDMFGNYNAVFTADSTLATSRYLQMTVKTNRLVTGYLKDTSTVKDLFPTTIIPANGHIDMTSAGGVHVVADLAWDGSEVSNGVKQVTGNVTIATLTTGLVADREDTKALPTKGLATMSIPGVSGNPGGNGFATLSLSGGKVTANYTLGDNDKQTVTWGLNGSRSGTIPQWVVTKTGVLFGNLNVNDGLTNLSASSLTWIRNTAGTTYPSLLPAGFTNSSFAAICSPYDKNVSQTGPFLITLSGGTLPNDVTQTVSLPFTSTTGPITSASVTSTNGIIKVTFFDGKVVGTSKKKTTAQGVVLQNATNGFGFFVCTNFSAPTNSGSLILTPQ